MVVGISYSNIFRISSINLAITGTTTLVETTAEPYDLPLINSMDIFHIAKSSVSNPFVARVDFAPIKNPTFTDGFWLHFVTDICDDRYLMVHTGNFRLKHYRRDTWSTDSDRFHADILIGSYGGRNNILNFGPYQYVVTIPSASASTSILFVYKPTFLIGYTFAFAANINKYTPGYGNLNGELERFYLVMSELVSTNIQSYYLTVADCTTRDAARICTTCIAGYYRSSLLPDNYCIPFSDFWYKRGLDAANNAQAPCTADGAAAGCLSCLNDYTKCTTCDVANTYYNLLGKC